MDAITYDLLFDILRYEKSKEDIQSLDKEFYDRIVEYLKTKDAILLNSQTSTTERELTRIQLNNVKKILTELYERREKKIINLALYRIKTGSDIINTDNLLEAEKLLFESIYAVLSEHKRLIIDNVLINVPPSMNLLRATLIGRSVNNGNSSMRRDVDIAFGNSGEYPQKMASVASDSSENYSDSKYAGDSENSEENSDETPEPIDSIKSVRFIKPVPKFLGSNLETYGPFEEHDIASLPLQIAKILIRKNRAEEIQAG